jgi:hypothetical protein
LPDAGILSIPTLYRRRLKEQEQDEGYVQRQTAARLIPDNIDRLAALRPGKQRGFRDCRDWQRRDICPEPNKAGKFLVANT